MTKGAPPTLDLAFQFVDTLYTITITNDNNSIKNRLERKQRLGKVTIFYNSSMAGPIVMISYFFFFFDSYPPRTAE